MENKRHLEVYFNHDDEWSLKKVVYEGKEFPFTFKQMDLDVDMYDGRTARFFLEDGGELVLYPATIDYHDITPPKPKCEACGQEIKNKPKKVQENRKLAASEYNTRTCSCGDYCWGTNWTCGPNGCYNRPA